MLFPPKSSTSGSRTVASQDLNSNSACVGPGFATSRIGQAAGGVSCCVYKKRDVTRVSGKEMIYAYQKNLCGWMIFRGFYNTRIISKAPLTYANITLSLKLTASLPLKMDGWKTFSFPFGASSAYFQRRLLFVSGPGVHVPTPK